MVPRFAKVDSGTLDALLVKFRLALEIMASECATCRTELTVAVVVLEKRLLLLRAVNIQTDWRGALRLGYVVRRGRVELNDVNGWCVGAL